MSIEELLAMAEENHWTVDYSDDGELVFFTGVIDESKVRVDADEQENLPDAGGELVIDDLAL